MHVPFSISGKCCAIVPQQLPCSTNDVPWRIEKVFKQISIMVM
jgi:hypothetical protein